MSHCVRFGCERIIEIFCEDLTFNWLSDIVFFCPDLLIIQKCVMIRKRFFVLIVLIFDIFGGINVKKDHQ